MSANEILPQFQFFNFLMDACLHAAYIRQNASLFQITGNLLKISIIIGNRGA